MHLAVSGPGARAHTGSTLRAPSGAVRLFHGFELVLQLALADIATVPFIARLDEIEPASLGAEGHPRVNDWWVRVRQRPAFKKARFDRFDETLRARQVGTAG